ncbi:30S ribosomal protein S6 [Candidatus Gracilibacteria bacterium]|nr:30S ribosomal protein S6 [Candidatus Gracilibacteria bacterium]MCF7856360.1 30S ribosomal protein S6 [Candidatus Gracilibacteria bacterium]MCF7896749.1 30S ribosomal protein S6 [Candidatus Gracilibacteria bacterium]
MTAKTTHSAQSYELLTIFAGSLRDSETTKELEKWEAELTKIGKILNKAVWTNRLLAYKIKQEERGTYLILQAEIEGEKIAELENNLRLDPKVIRHLICKTPKKYFWREYSEEDLEHDFKKLDNLEDDKMEKRFTKTKGPVRPAAFVKKVEPKKTAAVEKEAIKKEVEKPKANVGEIDKKLDDILADL